MSISTIATKDSYVGNNSNSTPYPITFKYFDSDHVTVYADGVEISSGGLNYCTFSGDGATGTGEFITSAIYAPAVTITVVLDVPLDQPVVLQEAGTLPAKTIEVEGFDRLNMQIRRVWRKLGDVLTFSSDEGGTGSTGTADNLLGFDGSGDIAEIPNTTFLQTANDLSDVTAATARTNLGVDAAGTDNSTDVTKAGTGTYVSLAGQVLTVDPIETSDINGFEAAVTANTSVAANTLKISATAANVKTGVEGASITDTGTPAPTDQVLYRDSISGDLQSADFADFGAAATDGDAIHKSTASEISALTAKATPIAGDFLVIEDSAAGNAKKSITIGNLPLPAAGTITEAMLNTSANLSLDKADTALQSIAADSITYDMIQDVATNNILGRSTGGTGTVEEISCTSAGRELLDDADASAQRTTLGVAIGSDVQAYSSTLDNIVTLPSVTDTASFTLLTNNITLTGVGLITGLAVGDVVEVSGSTSNDGFYTVDVITDDDNIIVNQAHANGTAGSGKTLTGETSTPSVTVTLDVKANHAPAGHGQAWIDVLSVRLNASTAYQNSTGRSIQIGHLGQDSDHLEISSDNVNWVQVMVSGGGGGNWRGAFPIVPNSDYYRVL